VTVRSILRRALHDTDRVSQNLNPNPTGLTTAPSTLPCHRHAPQHWK
jgi:hypothetical protein